MITCDICRIDEATENVDVQFVSKESEGEPFFRHSMQTTKCLTNGKFGRRIEEKKQGYLRGE